MEDEDLGIIDTIYVGIESDESRVPVELDTSIELLLTAMQCTVQFARDGKHPTCIPAQVPN
jgi:hypothetical protein